MKKASIVLPCILYQVMLHDKAAWMIHRILCTYNKYIFNTAMLAINQYSYHVRIKLNTTQPKIFQWTKFHPWEQGAKGRKFSPGKDFWLYSTYLVARLLTLKSITKFSSSFLTFLSLSMCDSYHFIKVQELMICIIIIFKLLVPVIISTAN